EDVRVTQADGAVDNRYGSQLTGGSLSIRQMYDPLRRAGAAAREMLIAAAAETWGVPRTECRTSLGKVTHDTSGRSLGYGELVKTARKIPVPDSETVPLKDPKDFRLLGQTLHRTDQMEFITGKAVFGSDHIADGMVFAAVARCPFYGGSVKGYDKPAAMKVPGVRDVIEVEGARSEPFYLAPGVAVIADTTWAAFKGVEALAAQFDPGTYGDASTDALRKRFGELGTLGGGQGATQGSVERANHWGPETYETLRDDGNVDEAVRGAANVVESTYELPFLAHATMEPMTCTIRVKQGACEIWSPTQNPQSVQRAVGGYLGIASEKVTVHVTLLGGGFGRRLYPDTELEAAMIARQVDAPVKVVWTRRDDMRHDRYRPSSHHVLRGAVDSKGLPIAWHWHILNTYQGRFDPGDFPSGAIPNYRVEYTHVPFVLPRGAWRATVNSQNPYVVQSFFDELAAAGGRDPMELRLEVLRGRQTPSGDDTGYDNKRMIRVVETAADKAGWGAALPKGVGRGTSFFFGYGAYVAEVAEVEVVRGRPRVRRVVCVVDCGEVINPDLVEAQCEGAIVFALSATLKQKITVTNDKVNEGNFDDYPMVEIGEMPKVESHIIANHESPGGMGEVPLPPLFAAVTNAIHNTTGTWIRTLPVGGIDG
ncbi:MAG: molybdopterin-dependent oxidoreductase, partial [bacterium]